MINRANGRCEYCLLPQSGYDLSFHIDHVIARQHGGDDEDSNLAFCCPRCNQQKGPNLAGIDPQTRTITPLFNPRKDQWVEHFAWNGPLATGKTACGRATITTLQINHSAQVRLRELLMQLGEFEAASDQ